MREIKEDVDLFTEYNNLYALYKNLLTERQILIMDKYFVYDLNEVEVAEELNITRNAVHDALATIVRKLDYYEAQLHLHAKYKRLQKLIEASELSPIEQEKLLEILYYGI